MNNNAADAYRSMNESKENKLTSSERNKIGDALRKKKLDGNGRFETVGEALRCVTDALDSLGFNLDMVSDHQVAQAHHKPGQKGSLLLTFTRKDSGEDGVKIDNSRISFNYENLGGNTEKPIEVVAYAS